MNDPSSYNAAVYNRHVSSYKSRFFDLGSYKETFRLLVTSVPEGGAVIELGCGPGNVIKYLRSLRPDLQFLGIDLSPEMICAAREENKEVEFRQLDLRSAGEIPGPFQAVIAAFSIPYIGRADLSPLFTTLNNLLDEEGWLYLSCMEGEGGKEGLEQTSFTAQEGLYITYHERGEITDLMTTHGFQIMDLSTKEYRELDGSVTIDLFFTARKKR